MNTARRYPESPAPLGDLVLSRLFDAPLANVWRAWSEPERVREWWAPKNFTTPFCSIEFRVGGSYLNCMRSPEGKDYWSTGIYREIVPLKRIVCTDAFADEQGNVVSAAHYGMSSGFPLEMMVTVKFEDDQGKTRLTLIHSGLPLGEDLDNCRIGWNESLDKLAEMLART